MFELLISAWIGTLVGMRHALEPDHLAAVATLISRERGTWRAAMLGACWGLGHTLALVAAGAVLVMLRSEMPERLATGFEFLVALMLIGLGARAVSQALRQGTNGPARLHHHGAIAHRHPGAATHLHVGAWTLPQRPLLVGAVHGLAGSGALTALVLATLPTDAARAAYVVLFGLGSTVGMAALSGLLGWPLARMGGHHVVGRAVSLVVGCVCTVLGVTWGYPLIDRLF